jgi:sialic acid synthase SpsE
VASITERIDLGCASNLMRVLIILIAPLKDVIARTSVVSNADLPAGHVITEADIWARRPGSGATAGNEFDKVVGKRVFVDQTHN